MLGDNGQPIVIEDLTERPTIDAEGIISDSTGLEIGRLDIVTFEDERELRSIGAGLYTTELAPVASEDFVLTQFALEGSNVNAITEMTKMMGLLRQYQSTQTMIDKNDTLDRKSITRIGQPI